MRIRTVGDVNDLYKRMSALYDKCRDSWNYDRDLYYMDHYRQQQAEGKGEAERIMVNKATNTVDISHSLLTLHAPRIKAQPITPSRKSDEQADKVEKFIAGVLYINNLRLQENQIAKAIFDQILYGRGAMFSGWDVELEGDEEDYQELPIVVKYVNHRNLYCLRGGTKRDIAQMYCCARTAEDLAAEWGVPIYHDGEEKAEDTEELIYKDLWWFKGSQVWNCTCAGATWLKPPTLMKYYHRLPFTEFVGRGTTSEELHLQSLGVLFPLREAVQILERWLNMGTTAVMHFVDPPLLYDDRLGEIVMEPGAAIPVKLSGGEVLANRVMQMPPSDAAAGVYRFISIAEQMVEEGGFSRWAYANVNPESGPVVQGMNANDRIRLTTYQENAELAISAVLQKMLDTAYAFSQADSSGKTRTGERAPRKLQVFSEGERSAIALSPSDLRGWLVTDSLSAKLPTDEARDIAIAANARQAGLPISTYTILQRFLGIEQPAEEMRRLMVDAWSQDPDLIALAKARAMAELGDEFAEAMAPGLGQPEAEAPNVSRPVLPPTSAMHPQMFQEMPPEGLQQRTRQEPLLQGIAPGAPRGPVP